jgi:hypothetical protein
LPDIDVSDNSPKQGLPAVVALDLRRIKGAVIASFTAWLAADMRNYECLWGRKASGEQWVMLPRRPWTAQDGTTHFAKLIAFGSDQTERAFQRAELQPVRELAERTPR